MPHVRANGVNLHYELTGPADAPVIAFAHSIGATLHMWDAQVAAFAGRYRCLRYDTRGHGAIRGRSPTPATVDDLADDLAGLLDALGIAKAHVVGLSLGGMTGQAFALRHPDRLDRLALVATSAEMDKAAWHERIETVLRDGYGSFIDVTMVPRWFTPAFAAAYPEVVAGFRARMMANDTAGYAACANVIATLDLPSRIAAITAPTLIIVGADDPATPVAMSERIRALVPHAEMVVIPEAAHIVAVEQPDVLNGYLGAFLARGDRRDAPRTGGVSFDDGLANRAAVLGPEYVDARTRQGRRLRRTLAGLHHPRRLGRGLGRPDAAVEDALDADARHDDRRSTARRNSSFTSAPALAQRCHRRRASRRADAGRGLCRRAGDQRRVPLGARGDGGERRDDDERRSVR